MLTTTRSTYLRVLRVPARAAGSWRVSDGGEHPFCVRLADTAQLPAATITRGDLLYCQIVQHQTIAEDGLRSEITVTEILTHHSAARRLL